MPRAKKDNKTRLVLLDMHAILHRAYHALPDFSTSKGEPTGALYGLVTMLLKIIGELRPDYIAAAYDVPKPTFRKIAYKEYKGTRGKTDDALIDQIKRSGDVLKALSIPRFEQEGFEADDVLGSIVEMLKDNKDVEIIIATGDMDTLQLVDEKQVKVYTLRKGIKDTVLYDEKRVEERFGFASDLLSDYKALRGDPSDNIPGIKGIGEKTATTLIAQFGSIENLYKELEKDREAFQKKSGLTDRLVGLLESGKEDAEFSKMLALIRRDVDLDFSLPGAKWKETVDLKSAKDLFKDLEFRTLGERLAGTLRELTGEAEEEKTENKEAGGGEGPQAALDLKEEEEQIDPARLLKTAIALWILDSTKTNANAEEIIYAADAENFDGAERIIFERLKKEEELHKVYTDIEEPLMPVIEKMEERGVRLDIKELARLSKSYHERRDEIAEEIYSLAGRTFNINSPKQLGEVLFDELEISTKGLSKTAGGARSTRESVLEKLRDEHQIINCILDYREVQKLVSTYVDVLPTLLAADKRLHATFLQHGTSTGRISSQNPNLQNIPIKNDLGRAIRKAFVPAEGFVLASLDYSQIELRAAAFLSGDEKLIEVFKSGGDIHTSVASDVFGVPEGQVDKEMRRRAKVINFGILYGMGVNALRQQLGTDRADAQDFLNQYFLTYSGLRDYLEKTKVSARQKGYTETLFGRRRQVADINARLPHIRAAAERAAINAPIQGTEADIIKLAMVEIDAWVRKEMKDSCHMVLQVHDELVFELDEKQAEACVKKIKNIMETIVPLDVTKGVPLKVEASVGDNWLTMKTI